MRGKIIIVNAGIVLVVGLLSYFLLATALGDVVSNPQVRRAEVERGLKSANARLALDALRSERWLAAQATRPETLAVFAASTKQAKSEAATALANKLRDAAVAEASFARMAPALVLFVDAQGVALGRNGSALMRDDKMGEVYPSLAAALASGQTASDVWLNRQRQEQMLASYAPVRGEDNQVIGALVIGTPLSDERLTLTSELTSGGVLLLGVRSGDSVEIVAKSPGASGPISQAAERAGAAVKASDAGQGGSLVLLDDAVPGELVAAQNLAGYGDGKSTVLVLAAKSSLVGSVSQVLWPVFAVSGLGVLLVVVGGILIGNYIQGPITELEAGLLQVLNGNANYRFEIEHAELGGIVHRLNSLLNALMGVPETDDDGRPSAPPQPGEYQE
ncbi:MAG: hypothetical protein KIT72_15255 [Polyangiaceae bacterium]|nr:hypothetical protein [Polyangiaceae bacterium]MCW5791773.1 hypothetical protein [Polyangiaceae bacterium]